VILDNDATFELVDLADYDLPHLDEPAPAAMGPSYTQPHTRTWAQKIASFDGYIFVTPEYNHSITGPLKNAIDYLYVEWHNKAAGFVSYGLTGGTRAVEHLRLIMSELQIAHVRAQVALTLSIGRLHQPNRPHSRNPTRTHAAHHARPTHRLERRAEDPTARRTSHHTRGSVTKLPAG
jgi:NAD(P)H-dependent FMN reductase